MPTHEIKKFFQDPTCSICGRGVKGWARAACDNCGRMVCRSHRPMFVSFWQCPSCVQKQQSFTSQPQQPSQQQNNQWPAMMQTASTLIEQQRLAEAENAIDEIFVTLFGEDE